MRAAPRQTPGAGGARGRDAASRDSCAVPLSAREPRQRAMRPGFAYESAGGESRLPRLLAPHARRHAAPRGRQTGSRRREAPAGEDAPNRDGACGPRHSPAQPTRRPNPSPPPHDSPPIGSVARDNTARPEQARDGRVSRLPRLPPRDSRPAPSRLAGVHTLSATARAIGRRARYRLVSRITSESIGAVSCLGASFSS